MYPEPQQRTLFGDAHPIMLIGILLFILPFFGMIPGVNFFPDWLKGVGILFILIGAGLSIYKIMNKNQDRGYY